MNQLKALFEWSRGQFPIAEKAWTEAGGEPVSFAPAEAKRINDLVRPIGPQVMAERPQVKEFYDLLLATAQKHR